MNKNSFSHGSLYIHTKENSNKIDYTLRYIVFDPKRFFVSTDFAKDVWRIITHKSKKKMNEEYDSVYAEYITIGRGKNKHVKFSKVPKNAANIIFIVPKAWRRHSYKVISNLELPYDKKVFK